MIKIECDHKQHMTKVEVNGSTADIMVDGLLTCMAVMDIVRTHLPDKYEKFLEILVRDVDKNFFSQKITIDTSVLREGNKWP